MKKILATLAVCGFVVGMMVGCGGDAKTPAKTKTGDVKTPAATGKTEEPAKTKTEEPAKTEPAK